MADLRRLRILVRGAGEMATGVAHRLIRSRFRVLMTEIASPLAVRRLVCFSEAVYDGRWMVEGVAARRVDDLAGAEAAWSRGEAPVLVDPRLACLGDYRPDVLVEATLAKRNNGLEAGLAPLVIALGPGFRAPRDAHFVVETNRGHNLGRVYGDGEAEPDTGVPGEMGGFTHQRVLRAPTDGVFEANRSIGDAIRFGESVGTVAGREVRAAVGGLLRGLIRPGLEVSAGLKIGDVDPRSNPDFLDLISEKARALGGSVLECMLGKWNT